MYAVEVIDVARRFGPVQALAGIDLAVGEGEFFGLLGPNGAGKTTLISILAGLTRADRGSARILGHDVIADFRAARRNLGVVPQELVFDPFFSVRETLEFQAGYFGLRNQRAWIDEILHHLDLTSKANANMRSLSGGMKRRVLVGQALVHKPPVIVLDEPTAGVDVELRQSLWGFIRKLNRDGHTIASACAIASDAAAKRSSMNSEMPPTTPLPTLKLLGRRHSTQPLPLGVTAAWRAAVVFRCEQLSGSGALIGRAGT